MKTCLRKPYLVIASAAFFVIPLPSLALSGNVVVEDTPGQLLDAPLAQPDYLWHYGSASPAFTLDDTAGFGALSAGDTVTLSGSMTLTGNNHRDYWDDRLVLAAGTGNGPASDNHPYAASFGYAGGNSKVYALAVSLSPLGGFADDNSRPPLEVIDALGKREVATTATRRSPTVVWELSITLAGTWKDYSTGDNTEQDNGRGIERHEHSYTLSLDLDYDGTFETIVTGTFKTYQAESIGIGFAVEQADARYFKPDPDDPSGPWVVDEDLNTWGAAAQAVNEWTLFINGAGKDALYPRTFASGGYLSYDLTAVKHTIQSSLFGTNIEHFDTGDSYWGSYGENSELVRLMKERPVSWIRFPGGEPTSFYHFDSESKKMTTTANWGVDEWDTSKSEAERALAADNDYVDFDEFADIVKHTDTTPFIGINLESAYYFRALEVDKELLDPANAESIKELEAESSVCEVGAIPSVKTAKWNFLTDYSSEDIQDGLDQARAVALYMDELALDVRHWYLDNESDLPTYYPELSTTFTMYGSHYARMSRDYISEIDQATGRTNNEYIVSWNNVSFMRDLGWKQILDDVGSLVDYLDFHTYWWVHGGSWSLNLTSLPHMSFPTFGVSSWELWKKQLPMRWENFDDDDVHFCTGVPETTHMSPTPTEPVSLGEYFGLVRKALDNSGHTHIKIMLSEWGVAPRGHWRLDPTLYQISLMLSEYFMQMLSSEAIDAAASWPFSSHGGPFLDNRHNILHKPDGSNEVIASYTMQKLFKPFIDGKYVEVGSDDLSDLVGVGAYHADAPSLHLALLNKSSERRVIHLPVKAQFNAAQVSDMVAPEDPTEYDNTFSAAAPVFRTGETFGFRLHDPARDLTLSFVLEPWSLTWINLTNSQELDLKKVAPAAGSYEWISHAYAKHSTPLEPGFVRRIKP